MKKIGLLNGPNLDRLGKREPSIYGSHTLKEIEDEINKLGTDLKVKFIHFNQIMREF